MDPYLLKENLISTKVAADLSGYSPDYIARLCKGKSIDGVRVGRTWLVERSSLERFIKIQADRNAARARALAESRGKEYAEFVKKPASPTTPDAVPASSEAASKAPRAVPAPYFSYAFSGHAVSLAVAVAIVAGGAALARADVLGSIADHSLAMVTESAGVVRSASAATIASIARHALETESRTSATRVALKESIAQSTDDLAHGALLPLTNATIAARETQMQIVPAQDSPWTSVALEWTPPEAFAEETKGNFSPRLSVSDRTSTPASLTAALEIPRAIFRSVYALGDMLGMRTGNALPALLGAYERSLYAWSDASPRVVAYVAKKEVAIGERMIGAKNTALAFDTGASMRIESFIPRVFGASGSEQALPAAAYAGAPLTEPEYIALFTYETIRSLFDRTAETIAYILTPPTVILPQVAYVSSGNVVTSATSTGAVDVPLVIHQTGPTYVTNQYIAPEGGASIAYVDAAIGGLRALLYQNIDSAVRSGARGGGTTVVQSGGGSGSVTSVDASGGTTGFSFAGGPVTSSGTLTLSGILDIDNGGTGIASAPAYGQVLLGDGAGGYDLVATSSLGIAAGGNPSWGNIIGTLSNQTDLQSALDAKLSLADWYATTTDGLDEGTNNLYWTNTRFDNRLSATTTLPNITTLANLGTIKTSLTGILKATAGALSAAVPGVDFENPLTFAYPLVRAVNNITLAFGTTTANTWGPVQTFTNAPILGALSGLVYGNNGTLATAATSTLGVTNGLAVSSGALGYQVGGTNVQIGLAPIAANSVLANQTGGSAVPAALATSSLGIALSDTTGTLAINRGGTGTSTVPTANKLLFSDANGNWEYVATSSLGINSAVWGSITGILSDQTDLQNALNAKFDASSFDASFYTYFHATTTDALAEGATNKYWSNTLFDNRLTATTTLPNITTLANLGTVSTSLTGVLKAAAGVLSVAVPGTDFENPLTFSYPLVRSANNVSLAFGTTTSNTWGGTQTFTNSPILGALSGLVYGNNGALSSAATTTITTSGALSFSSSDPVVLGSSPYALSLNNDATLQVSGGNLGINLANPNTWTALQQFNAGASSTQFTSTGNTYLATTGGNVGIGTTSPYAKLSVAGQVVADYYTATTSATSTFAGPLSVSQLAITGNNGLLKAAAGGYVANAVPGTDYVADASGNWTGTFDGQEGSYYLDATHLTNFGVPFYNFFSATTTDALAQGSVNKYWSNTLFDNRLTATTTLPNITTLANLGTVNTALTGILRATAGVLSTGSVDLGSPDVTNVLGQANGGTGIASYNPGDLLYADGNGDLTALPLGVSGQVLKVSGGGLPQWGVDQTTGGGGGAGAWATTSDSLAIYPTDTSDVVIIGDSATSSLVSIFEVHGKSYFNNNVGIGTTTPGARLSVEGHSLLGNYATAGFFIATTSATSTFAGPLSTLNLAVTDLASGLVKVGAGGYFQHAVPGTDFENPLTFSYPLVRLTNNVSLAFGTTTSNTWGGTQTFTNNPVLGTLSGIIYGNNGALAAAATSSLGIVLSDTTGTLTVDRGGTGTTTFYNGGVTFYDSGLGTLSQASAQGGLYFDKTNSRLGIGTTSPYAKLSLAGTAGGTTPVFALSTSTAGFATSTALVVSSLGNLHMLAGAGIDIGYGIAPPVSGLLVQGNAGIGTSSPFAQLSVGMGSTTPAFVVGAAGSSTPSLYVGSANGNGYVGIRTFTPSAPLDINATAANEGLRVTRNAAPGQYISINQSNGSAHQIQGFGSKVFYFTNQDTSAVVPGFEFDVNGATSGGSGTRALVIMNSGFVGIASTTPAYRLSVEGSSSLGNQAIAGFFTATTTIASTFPNASTTLASVASGLYNTYLTTNRVPYTTTNGLLTDSANLTFNGTTLTANTLALTNALPLSSGGTATTTFYNGGVVFSDGTKLTQAPNTSASALFWNNGAGRLGINTVSPTNPLDVAGFINTDQYSGYKIANRLLGYASTTNETTIFGLNAGGDATTTASDVRSTAFGRYALNANNNGFYNTALGYQTLLSNTAGSYNTAAGEGAMREYTTGSYNAAFGYYALGGTTTVSGAANTGEENTAVGYKALRFTANGFYNTAVGYKSMWNNISGSSNVSVGDGALYSSYYSPNNVAIGKAALEFASSTIGGNVAIGYEAGNGNLVLDTGSSFNNRNGVYIGYRTGHSLGDASDFNTFLGSQAGYNVTTGAGNILIGAATSSTAVANLTTGSQNILIGTNISLPSATLSGQLNIGNLIYGTGVTGTGSAVSGGNIGIGTTSPGARLSVEGASLLGNSATAGFFVATTSATSTFAGPLSIPNLAITGNSGLLKASAGGYITNAAPGTDFENPLTFSYPLVRLVNNVSLAFGTTTANNWSQLQQFFGNASTSQLTATSSAYFATLGGSVGIGTVVPAATLAVVGDMTVGSSGTVGAGGYLQRLYSTTNSSMQSLYYQAANSSGPVQSFQKYRGSGTEISNNDDLGTVAFYGVDSTGSSQLYAQILAEADAATATGGDAPGRLSFFTTPDGSATPVQRLVIKNTGNVGIGTTTPGARLAVEGASLLGNFASAGFFLATTSATSTFAGPLSTLNLAITNIASGNLLKTGAGGYVVPAVAGTDYLTSASGITSVTPQFGSAITGALTLASSTSGTDFSITGSGNTVTFNLPTASASNRGLLSSTDWSTFNGKQAAGNYITALTGDVTASGPGSAAATLATVNANVGSFTNASITVNGKGLITAASSGATPEVPLAFAWPLVRLINTISFNGLSTSTPAVVGNIPYFSGPNTFANVATGTVSNGTGISVTAGQSVIGSGLTITNTGVTSLLQGNLGIGLSGATGAVTISNNGVLSLTGTPNQITASASTGDITLSIPSQFNIQNASTTNFSANTLAVGATGTTTISATGTVTTPSLTIGSLTGPLQAINGLVSATSTLSAAFGGTGTTTFYNGGVVFSDGTKLTQAPNTSSSALFWDNANGRLGIGSTTPSATLSVGGFLALGSTPTTTPASPGTFAFDGTYLYAKAGIGTTTAAGNPITDGWFNLGLGNQVDVFLVAGQSNMLGPGDAETAPVAPLGQVMQYWHGQILNEDSLAGTSNDDGAWASFALTYYRATGRRVAFVNGARGSTSQVAAACYGNCKGTWDTTGEFFSGSVGTTTAALGAFRQAGYTPVFKGVLWGQGGTDGVAINDNTPGVSQASYEAALKTMIANYRARFGANMPFYIFRSGTLLTMSDLGQSQVRAAQEDVAANDFNTRIVFASDLDYPSLNYIEDDLGHYNQNGNQIMGRIAATNVVTGGAMTFFQHSATSTKSIYYTEGNVGIGTTTPFANLAVQNPFGSITPFILAVASSTNRFGTTSTMFLNVTNAGNVGIGTTSPYAKLSVAGQAVAAYFTSTTTTASVFPNASTTQLSVASGLYNTYLTTNRVPYTTTAGLLTDSANLTFDGTTLTANTLNLASMLTVPNGGTGTTTFYNGGVVFSDGTKLTQSAAPRNFFWDETNKRLGIGNASPSYPLDVAGFVNTDQYSGYKQAGNTVLYASTTNSSLALGASSAAAWMSATSTITDNIAIGQGALAAAPANILPGHLFAAIRNVGIGTNALAANSGGDSNTAVGYSALFSNTSGLDNTAIGAGALALTTTGYYNTAVGLAALQTNVSGFHNTAIGMGAGRFIADGTTPNQTASDSTYLGYGAFPLAAGGANEIVIGYNAVGNGSNSATLGNTGIARTILNGNVGVGTSTPGARLSIEGASLLGNSATAGFFIATTSATSTFAGPISIPNLAITGNSGILKASTGGYIVNAVPGTDYLTSSTGVTSVSNVDGTLTITPTTGAVIASLNVANPNTWTGLQQFSANASSTQFTSTGNTYLATGGGFTMIGTTTAPYTTQVGSPILSVAGSIQVGKQGNNSNGIDFIRTDGTSGTAYARWVGSSNSVFGISNSSSSGVLRLLVDASNGNSIQLYGKSNVEIARADVATNNFAIGSTSPFARLSVNGASGGTIPLFVIASSTTATASTTALQVSALGNLHMLGGTGIDIGYGIAPPTNGLLVQGNVGIGTTSPYSLLSISNSVSTPANTPLFTIASTTAGTATSTFMTVLANGNVGIGTTSPANSLEVHGNLYADNGGAVTYSVIGTSNVKGTAPGTNDTLFVGTTSANINMRGLFVVVNASSTPATATIQGLNTQVVWSGLANNVSGGAQGGGLRNRITVSNTSVGYGVNQMSGLTIQNAVSGTLATSTNASNYHSEAPSVDTGNLITNFRGFWQRNTSIGAGTLTNSIGVNVESLANGTNNTELLLGTATAPSGNYAIYQADAYTNYFAGKVGIASSTPGALLAVHANNGALYPGNNLFAIGSSTASATTTLFKVDNAGNATFSGPGGTCVINGSGACTSDSRLKKNIEAITGEEALSKLSLISGVTYNWRDPLLSQGQQVGIIAQDVAKAFPQLTGTVETQLNGVTGTYYTVNYAGLVSPLISAVNALNARTGFIRNAAASSTVPALAVDAAGNIGIRTGATNRALSVSGDIGISGTVYADGFALPAGSFASVAANLGFASTSLPSVVLTEDASGIDLYKLATYSLGSLQSISAELLAIGARMDSLEDRIARLEDGSIGMDAAPGTFASSTLASALEGFGAFVREGIAQFGTLVADRFVAAADSAGNSSAGSGMILAGNTAVEIENVYAAPSDKIFVTFTGAVNGGWYLADKKNGSFRIRLEKAQQSDVSFDYFIVGTKGQVATSTAAAVISEEDEAGDSSPANWTPETDIPPPPTGNNGGAGASSPDTLAPVITLAGDAETHLAQGAVWEDPGASASDDRDGDLTPDITKDGAVDTATPGSYTVTYRVADAAGNEAHASRAVTVIAPPVSPAPEEPPAPGPEAEPAP